MKPRIIVSYPRSGQHLVAAILERIFCFEKLPYKYCDTYNCSGIIPCKCNPTVQKWHDFDLMDGKAGLSIEENERYLVLYRKDKIENLEAYYRFLRRNGIYSIDDFLSFYKSPYNYYDRFVQKWVFQAPPNVYALDYNELMVSPNEKMTEAFYHLYPEFSCETIIPVNNFLYRAHGKIGHIKKNHHIHPLIRSCIEEKIKYIEDIKTESFNP